MRMHLTRSLVPVPTQSSSHCHRDARALHHPAYPVRLLSRIIGDDTTLGLVLLLLLVAGVDPYN